MQVHDGNCIQLKHWVIFSSTNNANANATPPPPSISYSFDPATDLFVLSQVDAVAYQIKCGDIAPADLAAWSPDGGRGIYACPSSSAKEGAAEEEGRGTAVDLRAAFAQQQQAAAEEQHRIEVTSELDSAALSTAAAAATIIQFEGGDSSSRSASTKSASGETTGVLIVIETAAHVRGVSCGDGADDAPSPAGDGDGCFLPKPLLRQSSLAGERLESVTQFGAVTDIDVEGNSEGYLTARYYCELNRFDAQRAIAAYFDADRTPPPAGYDFVHPLAPFPQSLSLTPSSTCSRPPLHASACSEVSLSLAAAPSMRVHCLPRFIARV